MKDKFFYSKKTLNIQGKLLDLSTPAIMGILNVTPDSFYDGGSYSNETKIIKRAEEIIHQGATIIDIGGYSSRPGASDISVEEEIKRVVLAIKSIKREFPESIISIDTFRSAVAKVAVQEGASVVNDISGGSLDPEMFNLIKELKVPYIMMHMKSTPQNMTNLSTYNNLMTDIIDYFQEKLTTLSQLGVNDIIIDPGIGFAKNIGQNFELLKNLTYLKTLKMPILVGLSRKSLIYKTLHIEAKDSLNGTTALNTIALINGADIIRVHDVKECVEAIKLYKSVYP